MKNRSVSVSAEESLQDSFTHLQNEMVKMGMTLGLNHPDVLKKSQELDSIHNQMLRKHK